MEELIKLHNPEFNERDIFWTKFFAEHEKAPLKPVFNLKGFIFSWFYLLYKKAYMESFAVIIISLLIIQGAFILHSFLFLGLGLIFPNLVVGFYFYFMFANKMLRDIEFCGKPIDKECLKSKGGTNIYAPIFALIIVILLFWPVIYGKITHQDVTTEQNKYINKVEKVLK
jgi:hypothetical protein